MTAVEYILDGLNEYLELERELGVRSVEFDRSLLAETGGAHGNDRRVKASAGQQADYSRKEQQADYSRKEQQVSPCEPVVTAAGKKLDFVFLHDRALSPKGNEMMSKIIVAMHRTADTAPVIIMPPFPQAKYYVVLGGFALRKFFPGLAGTPGQWTRSADGRDVLVTYSPEYILRFPATSSAVKEIKQSMWLSLKTLMRKLES